jgi:hypothetical protein
MESRNIIPDIILGLNYGKRKKAAYKEAKNKITVEYLTQKGTKNYENKSKHRLDSMPGGVLLELSL